MAQDLSQPPAPAFSREAFERRVAASDRAILSPELDNGRSIVDERSAIYWEFAAQWAETQCLAFSYEKPFALVALGGTARREMTPFSDTDFAFLFDDAIEGNAFLLELQRQTLHSDEFENANGFRCEALPFNFDDIPGLDGKQLNSFLDMAPIYDPQGLVEPFRAQIRATYDPFSHFLHVRSFWKEHWKAAAEASERIDRFDIKNDGLRLFLAGVWILAGKDFRTSKEIYATLADPRDLQAYEFLLRIRSFVHLVKGRRGRPTATGAHPEDLMAFDDFLAFERLLGPEATELERFTFSNEVRSRLLSARRRVSLFAKSIIQAELNAGRRISPRSPIRYGAGGLYHGSSHRAKSPLRKSSAALSLLFASQRYGIPIDHTELQSTFRNAGDWLVRTPKLSNLFYEEQGSLADSFAFLSQVEGAEERLFPGYARFESSLDERVMTERKSLRSQLERDKTRALETYLREGRAILSSALTQQSRFEKAAQIAVPIEAALLDTDHLAAIRLALKTKRLPVIPQDIARRADTSRPLLERFSTGFSGIPLADYFKPFASDSGFSRETLDIATFLIANRRAFKDRSASGINDATHAQSFARLCQTEHRLRALFVFTCCDRVEWETELENPARWFNTKELYGKTLRCFQPAHDPTSALNASGYTPHELEVLKDFGEDFFAGRYIPYANRFGPHLIRLVEEPDLARPKVALVRDGASVILGVAARDYQGLAGRITGFLWERSIDLAQAHLFSAVNYGIALDFFHLKGGDPAVLQSLPKDLEDAIELSPSDDHATVPELRGDASIREWSPGLFCLRFETEENASGIVYALAQNAYRHLQANIFGLVAHASRDKSFVSIYHSLPPHLDLEAANAIVQEKFFS